MADFRSMLTNRVYESILHFNWTQPGTIRPKMSMAKSIHSMLTTAEAHYTVLMREKKLASIASAILLESQLESIPQAITGQPKSAKRFFFNEVIPYPTALTLPAWQSICELASSTIPIKVNALDVKFWTCFICPTLADSSHDTGSAGILPPTHAIPMRDGYGMFEIVLAIFTEQFGWRIRHITDWTTDVSDAAYNFLFRALSESGELQGFARDIVRGEIARWRYFDPVSDWNLCPLYSSAVNGGASNTYRESFGVDLAANATDCFERVLADHNVGFRFSNTLSLGAWVNQYLESWKTQYEWHLACTRADAPWRVRLLMALDEQLTAWVKSHEVDKINLIIDMDQIASRLGL